MKKTILKKKLEKKSKTIKGKELNSENKNLILSNKADTKSQIFNRIKPKNWSDLKGFFHLVKTKMNPEKTMLIRMELDNGFHTSFIVYISKNYFIRNKRMYVIEDEFKYYDIGAQFWVLDYHESFSIPIKRDIEITKLKREILNKGITDVDKAINPSNLKQFIEDNMIEKVMKGQKMDEFFRFLKIMIIIVAILCFLTLAILVKSSGILSNMRIPFL